MLDGYGENKRDGKTMPWTRTCGGIRQPWGEGKPLNNVRLTNKKSIFMR